MRTRPSGFTLVELLVVSLLTGVVLFGVYQTVTVQEESYGAAGLLIHDPESLRAALTILESELAEVSAIGGASIGYSDIRIASPDSITFRAQRKTGFVCKLDRSAHRATVWTVGDDFADGDEILLFVDNDSILFTDDRWDATTVTGASSTADPDCDAVWDQPLQSVEMEGQDMTGVQPFAPIRAFEYVTYSLRRLPSGQWALARRKRGDATPDYLADGLAPPGQGLQFEYFTPTGAATTDPTRIAEIRINLRTEPGAGVAGPAEMATNLHLRNN